MLCEMEVEPNLFLNQTGSKFFMKMAKNESLKIPKNWSKDQTRGSPKKQKRGKTKTKSSFEIKNWKTLIQSCFR